MQQTENYKFNLPDGTDKVNITKLNENFEKVDTTLHNLEKRQLIWRTIEDVQMDETTNRWRWEKWSDGFNKIWCRFSSWTDIIFDRTNSATCKGYVYVVLPNVFILAPDYVSVSVNSAEHHVSCVVNQISERSLMLMLVNHEVGTETESTISKDEISFYIEISGYVQQSSEE